MGVRLLANTFLRFPYVFLDAISKGLGLPLTTVTTILSIRELGGVTSPLIGRAVDGGHLRRGLLWSGLVTGAAAIAAVVFTSMWWFAALMFVGGAARVAIDVSQNVWIGRKIPLQRRARVVGLVEISWAGAFLVGAPVLGLVIGWFGWRAAFYGTGAALMAATLLTVGANRSVGARDGSVEHAAEEPNEPLVEISDHVVSAHPVGADAPTRPRITARWAILAFNVFQPIGQMSIFAINGDWFADHLHMSLTSIGTATIVLGVGELAGTSLVAAVTDKVGPSRASIAGMACAAPLMALLFTNPQSVIVAVGLLALMNVAIEFAFVSVLPLMSEMGTDDRGNAFGQAITVNTVARAAGAFVAGFAYDAGGIAAAASIGAVATTAGAVVMAVGSRPRDVR